MTTSLHKAAQEYIINKGWPVIPVNITYREGKKTPSYHMKYWDGKNGVYGLDDPGLVIEAFGDKYESLAIATGFRSGITVIDIDLNKETGKVDTPLDSFPETYTVKTKSGGYHLYYQYFSEITNGVRIGGDQFPGIDCRNDGGNVYAPPTEGYEVIKDIDPQPFPVAMFKDIDSAKSDRNKFKGLQAVESFRGMEEGGRNNALFTFAANEYRIRENKEWKHIDVSVMAMNSLMKRPLPQAEVEIIVKSAKSYNSDNSTKHGLNLVKNKNGVPEATVQNLLTIFRGDPDFKDLVRANTFFGKIESKSKGEWVTHQAAQDVLILEQLSIKYPFLSKIGKDRVWEVVSTMAVENKCNPVGDYFESIKWDGKERLPDWVPQVYRVPNDAYYREMGKNYVIGMVSRVLNPGCQMDNAIVIDGHQGFGKSRSLRALCDFSDEGLGNLFNETSEKPEGKDFVINMLGNIITEFSEGAVFRHVDRKKIKGFITNRIDKYRPPYERQSGGFPRQCVFAMSTNDAQYLSDDGENRRWWPIIIDRGSHAEADIAWLKENRNQMIAEAVAALKKGYKYWEFTKEAEKILAGLRRNKEEAEDLLDFVNDYYLGLSDFNRAEGVQASDIHILAKNDDVEGSEVSWARIKIKEYLTGKLYLVERRRVRNGKTLRLFMPTGKTPLPYNGLEAQEDTGSSPPGNEIDF